MGKSRRFIMIAVLIMVFFCSCIVAINTIEKYRTQKAKEDLVEYLSDNHILYTKLESDTSETYMWADLLQGRPQVAIFKK